MIVDTPRNKATARAIACTNESYPPTARPNYATWATLPDGPGGARQVTFGAHQATDRSDSLDKIVRRYRDLAIETHGEQWDDLTLADELAAYLPLMAENTALSCARLAADPKAKALFLRAAADPLMQRAQEEIFERYYMRPAIEALQGSGWRRRSATGWTSRPASATGSAPTCATVETCCARPGALATESSETRYCATRSTAWTRSFF
jgi:hypothetical protein